MSRKGITKPAWALHCKSHDNRIEPKVPEEFLQTGLCFLYRWQPFSQLMVERRPLPFPLTPLNVQYGQWSELENTFTTAMTGIRTPRFPALLDAWRGRYQLSAQYPQVAAQKRWILHLSLGAQCITASYLQSGAFVWGPLAGSLPFEAQLNEKLQQVDEQLVHHLLGLEIGCYITQSINHSQWAVSTCERGEI